MDCVFCAIVSGGISADVIHRDDTAIAFTDLNPQAPVHFLVVPVRHAAAVDEFTRSAPAEAGHVLEVAARLGRERAPDGYRLVLNTGENGGQTVGHVHVHVLGGRRMGWPPG